jgi:hypothetical protein
MKTKLVSESLNKDLAALGVPGLTEESMVRVALGPGLSESLAEGCKGGKGGKAADACKDCGEEPCTCDDEETSDDEEGEDYEESKHDPIDGPFVTPVLFDRIMALPFESLTGQQVDQVIEELKVKRVPRNIEGIAERAEIVARKLMEARKKAIIVKGKRKRITIANDPAAKKQRRERRLDYKKHRSQITKKRNITARRQPAKIAAARTAAAHARLGDDFAVELEHLLHETQDMRQDVRSEILGRIDRIVEMITDEFDDTSVDNVFESACEPISASYQAGRLDEDVMNADAFLAEIRPVMSLISKSLDRLERGDRGNA